MIQQKSFEEMKELLVKIQKLVNDENSSSFSALDKDLLLSYIRKFYEEVLNLEVSKQEITKPKEDIKPIKEKIEAAELPEKEEPKVKQEITPPLFTITEEKIFQEEKEKTEYPKISIGGNLDLEIPKIEPQKIELAKKEEPEPVVIENIAAKEKKQEEVIDLPKPTPKPNFEDLVNKVKEQFDNGSKHQVKPLVSNDEDDDEPIHFSDIRLDMLFDSISSKELSDRLSQSPIQDIGRSMGLNERIFTLNELFDGDNSMFEEILDKLNNARDFNHAKEIISNQVAGRFNWLAESRIKKAKDFIKLVKRRYI